MKLELRHLRAVTAVAQHLHFSEAARSLGISQPNLSRLIRAIETALETRLFDRHTRGVVLTPFGREFVRHARSVLDLHESGMADLSKLIEMRRGHVTVAALPSVTTSLLADALHVMRPAHPTIDISVLDDVASAITDLVREARVDFGIGLATGDMDDLECQPLVSDHLMAVCQTDHALAAKRSLRWKDLAEEPIIAFAPGSSIRPLLERAFAVNGMTLRPAIEVHHLTSAEGLARHGLGIAIMPSTRAMKITEPGLRAKPVRDPVMTRDLVLIQRRGLSLSPAAQVMRDLLVGLSTAGPAPRRS